MVSFSNSRPFGPNRDAPRRCEAVVADSTDMVQIDECVDCKVFLGASGESVFIRDCKGCTFYVACKQLRLRDCHDCKFSLYSQTEPVIETSDGITFTPFSGGFEGQEQCMRSVNLDPKINFWWGIFDFNDEAKTVSDSEQKMNLNLTLSRRWRRRGATSPRRRRRVRARVYASRDRVVPRRARILRL